MVRGTKLSCDSSPYRRPRFMNCFLYLQASSHATFPQSANMASFNASPQAASSEKNHSSIRYLETTAAYDLWSEVYDTDGNFLQALDDLEMRSLLPQFLSQINTPQPWKLVDMGCGTGRTTLKLLHLPESTIVGIDASPKMLEIAKSRVEAEMKTKTPDQKVKMVEFKVHDLLRDTDMPASTTNADAIISTLVIEHVPIEAFFAAASKMLKPGGAFLVTNMHSEMGGISQAGFVDPKTGDKIRPQSYAHRLEDVIKGAEKHRFEVIGEGLERAVDERTSEVLGPRAKKWIGVTVWFGVCFRKKV
jgi:2-polyprenyl-3-methyl-5-hydroxy-6-metoxy-1,4-benzoquinol methylase